MNNNLFALRIKNISKVSGVKEVYDLVIPQTHNFIANGIISSNTGKSYSLGVIAEGIIDLPSEIKQNLSIIIFDTMGIYWTMKYPNEKDEDLLEQWGLKGKGLDVKIYTPYKYYETYKKEGIPTDKPFSIKPTELTAEDWSRSFGLEPADPVGVVIEKILQEFDEKGITEYGIDDILEAVKADKETDINTKNSTINHFKAAKRWGLFSEKGTEIDELSRGGQVTIVDVSCYTTGEGGWGVNTLVVGLICKKLFTERMVARKKEELEMIKTGYSYFKTEEVVKERKPLVWFVLDEGHAFLPRKGKTAATDALVTILREGRQPGVSLIVATQQPGKIHEDVTTQSDIVLCHRITAKPDVDALNQMMQSYMTQGLTTFLNNLPRELGAGVLLDDNSERIYPMRVRPRFTWHGGESPTAIKAGKKFEL